MESDSDTMTENDKTESTSRPKESTVVKFIQKKLPITNWLPKYTLGDVVADLVAGLTVGMTMIPQSVAYASLAGLEPQYGLYTAFIGSFTYVFVGTVKEVSIGPTSLMALLTFSYTNGKPIECVILLTFLAGCIELAMGIFRLGFLVDFISPCLTSGFTSATSIIIIVSQLKGFLGVKVTSHKTVDAVKEIISQVAEIKFADTFLGFVCVGILLAFKQLNRIKVESSSSKKLLWLLSISKNALVVLTSSSIAFFWKNYADKTPFKLTGDVPSGLPDFGPPSLSVISNGTSIMSFGEMIYSLGSGIIVIPVVAVLANVAIAKAYSAETIVEASQEMISLGICNIFGSFVKAMPSCGAFTRSSVASSSDVRTPMQGIYSGAVIILALSFLAPYFAYIPKSTLSAVLIVAASSLIDYKILITLWKCSKIDFLMTIITFLFGIFVSVELSIVVGSFLNALVLLKSWSRPKIITETRISENNQTYLYVRPELGIMYPGADFLSECIKKNYKKSYELPIVLDCSSIINIDYSSAKTIETISKTHNKKQDGFLLLNMNENVLKRLNLMTDGKYLALCPNSNEIGSRLLAVRNVQNEDESPLIVTIKNKLSDEKRIDVRKGSLCDVE